MRFTHVMVALLIASIPPLGEAAEWRYALGLHDLVVPQVDSHTYGIDAAIMADHRTDGGQHLFGAFDLLLDRDKDHLDPDHIPIWWQLHAGAEDDLWRHAPMRFGWRADLETRMNTASSMERQMSALPALVAGYDGAVFKDSLELGAGWFFLEIDDDAPRTRGFDRVGLRNSTAGYALTDHASFRLGEGLTLSARARRWWEGDETLESQYGAQLRGDAPHWLGESLQESAWVLDADFHEYNLAHYNEPGLPPVLGWDHDLLLRLSLESRW